MPHIILDNLAVLTYKSFSLMSDRTKFEATVRHIATPCESATMACSPRVNRLMFTMMQGSGKIRVPTWLLTVGRIELRPLSSILPLPAGSQALFPMSKPSHDALRAAAAADGRGRVLLSDDERCCRHSATAAASQPPATPGPMPMPPRPGNTRSQFIFP